MRSALLLVGLSGLLASAGPVFTVQDPRIDENSGMVDLGALTVITNDSGDTGRLFVLDGRGRTVGVTTYADPGSPSAVDVEALAPAGGDAVWVGDIGDNRATRDAVVVRRVPVTRGDRSVEVPAYRLVYPDGPHDAETLLREPRTGRLYVVSKSLTGGLVYAAPRRLDPDADNRLSAVAEAPIYATDGAFLDGGRRVLLRSYGDARLFAFPSWRPLRTVDLPDQPQGESLSIGPGDRVRIGSEGRRQPVIEVALTTAGASPSPTRAGDTTGGGRENGVVGGDTGTRGSTTGRTLGTVAGAGAVWALVWALVWGSSWPGSGRSSYAVAAPADAVVRLRTVSPNEPGYTRRRAGKGFTYLDQHGERLAKPDVERIKALVIPPAWQDVWISPVANGHIQAVGTDVAGRRQYLYHPEWRIKRDEAKFLRVSDVARKLPRARAALLEHLAQDEMTLDRAAATAVRLLDLGYFRIGGDVYTDNESFGLTTLQRRHVTRHGDRLVFAFVGKSGVEHHIEIDDPLAIRAVETMRRRRSGGEQLMAYKNVRRWSDLDASLVNTYLRDTIGADLTAKDFRTWHATVIAAAALAVSDEPGDTKASRKRAVVGAMKEVASFLGNTPTIARSSYVDPRVIDLYEDGVTIEAAVRRTHSSPDERQAALEKATLRLLRQAPESGQRRRRRR